MPPVTGKGMAKAADAPDEEVGASENAPEPRQRPSSREAAATLMVVGAFVAAALLPSVRAAFAEGATPEQCRVMVDKYVEHLLFQANPSVERASVDAEREKARAPLAPDAESAGKLLDTCAETMTREQADCAIQASYGDAFERCLQHPRVW